jgi:hypothetical protein
VKKSAFVLSVCCLTGITFADDPDVPVRNEPPPAAPITQITDTAAAQPGPEPARFSADAKWEVAGYNNEEIVYTILVINQDTRIIHCNAELHGFYLDNGEKHSIADRQSTSVFPGKQATIGHWMGMDPSSGATYKVSCRAV